MNAPKVSDVDYIQFLIATQSVYTCIEAARCKTVCGHGWHFLTRLKCSRQVNPDSTDCLCEHLCASKRTDGGRASRWKQLRNSYPIRFQQI